MKDDLEPLSIAQAEEANPLDDLRSLFVYGSLLGGRAHCSVWPHEPLKIQAACIQASLYDLGPYPGIVPGHGRVLGEVHQIAEEHWEETIRALDQFEDYDPATPELNQYTRQRVTADLADGSVQTWVYFLTRKSLLEGLGERYLEITQNAEFLGSGCASWKVHRSRRRE